MRFTSCDFSYHSFTLAGLAFICVFRSLYMTLFSLSELLVVRFRLSSTMEKPLSTSFETFRASIAISTTYMRLIIFWRGDMGLFFIAIFCFSAFSLFWRIAACGCHAVPLSSLCSWVSCGHIHRHGFNHSGVYLV